MELEYPTGCSAFASPLARDAQLPGDIKGVAFFSDHARIAPGQPRDRSSSARNGPLKRQVLLPMIRQTLGAESALLQQVNPRRYPKGDQSPLGIGPLDHPVKVR